MRDKIKIEGIAPLFCFSAGFGVPGFDLAGHFAAALAVFVVLFAGAFHGFHLLCLSGLVWPEGRPIIERGQGSGPGRAEYNGDGQPGGKSAGGGEEGRRTCAGRRQSGR